MRVQIANALTGHDTALDEPGRELALDSVTADGALDGASPPPV
jgi:hypothetical protein